MESKYKSLTKWCIDNPSAYNTASRKGLLPEICKMFGWELPNRNKPNGYWTLELCKLEALKYKSRSEWGKNHPSSYSISLKNKWLDECCSHMILKTKPMGYWTLERCKTEALKYATRSEFIKGSAGAFSFLKKKGWLDECCVHMNTKNVKPQGYWTKERCKEEALKYDTRVDWITKNSPSYSSARKNGWLDECCEHMGDKRNKHKGYWTLERCKEDALKYSSRSEWDKNSGGYQIANKNRWIDKCCEHMVKHKWCIESCHVEALKYTSRKEWKNNDSSSYSTASQKGWIGECCSHMTLLIKPRRYWNKERCKAEASKYTSRSGWQKGCSGSYNSSKENGWYNECCSHMIETRKPNGYWTLERCKTEALKYSSRSEWIKGSGGSYDNASNNKWLEECCVHMNTKNVNPQGYWTKERCKEEALKYDTRGRWKKNGRKSNDAARRNGWLDELSEHMVSGKLKINKNNY